jgi:hypothetical protein
MRQAVRILGVCAAAALLAGALALPDGPARAIDGRGKYDVFGSGSVRCNQWERSRKLRDMNADRDAQWIAGYVTAYNRWAHDGRSIVPDTDPETLYAMVDRLCAANPLDTLSGVAELVILELKRQQ